MTTVKELIKKLYEFSPEAEIVIEDLVEDQEFLIVDFTPEENKLIILISNHEEEDGE